MKQFLLFLMLLCLAVCPALSETLSLDEMLAAEDAVMITQAQSESSEGVSSAAREDLIDRIISTAKALHDAAGGKA
ncbi:MAG: hypothetical protein IJB85_01830 [Clostridia bacterium]|nr:hypothetical protein [Clostridia bacterium]